MKLGEEWGQRLDPCAQVVDGLGERVAAIERDLKANLGDNGATKRGHFGSPQEH